MQGRIYWLADTYGKDKKEEHDRQELETISLVFGLPEWSTA